MPSPASSRPSPSGAAAERPQPTHAGANEIEPHPLSAELIRRIVEGLEEETGGRPAAELAQKRDRMLVALRKALDPLRDT